MSANSQNWNPEDYARFGAFVPVLGEPLLELLAPKPGEAILDVGCGNGTLTRKIVDAGATVTGIDSDAAMVEAARAKGITAHVMGVTEMTYNQVFDAAFSNAALHWVKLPEEALSRIHHALKPGGRFICEMGGVGNVASIRSALAGQLHARGVQAETYDPWYFPTATEYRRLLEEAGFTVASMELIERPTPIGADVKGWLKTFAGAFLKAIPPKEQDVFLSDTAADLRAGLPLVDGQYVLDYVRLRFKAVKS